MTDTLQIVEIKKSVLTIFGLMISGVLFTICGVWLINGGAADRYGEFSIYLGWVTCSFFGICTLVGMLSGATDNNVPVVISPAGFHDKRISLNEIPWTDISRVSTWTHSRTSLVHLHLTPNGEATLQLTLRGKISRWTNERFGFSGMYVNSLDLQISFNEFMQIIKTYAKAHNPTLSSDSEV
jgi:hypothetical protein